LFGPLTAKQFVYLGGGIGFFIILYSLVPLYIAILIGGPVAGLGAALAFYKRDGTPFTKLIEYGFYYFTRNKLYIWQHRNKVSAEKAAVVGAGDMYVPRLTESKLRDLSWSLDIREHMRTPDNNN
jgi:hypothetical protein